MMAEKETKVFAHAQFPALWEPIKTRDGHMQYDFTTSLSLLKIA